MRTRFHAAAPLVSALVTSALVASALAGCASNDEADSQATIASTVSRSSEITTPEAAAPQISAPTSPSAPETAPPETAPPSYAPSQSPSDARRDNVVPALAELSTADRIEVIAELVVDGERWVISGLPDETRGRYASTNYDIGDSAGQYGYDFITVSSQELLLLNKDGGIAQAYPMPEITPGWIHATDDFIYLGHIGDGGTPYSTLSRIDRQTMVASTVLFDAYFGDPMLPGWSNATLEQLAISLHLSAETDSASQGTPPIQGTPVHSWINSKWAVDLAAADSIFEPSATAGEPAPLGSTAALKLLAGDLDRLHLEGVRLIIGNDETTSTTLTQGGGSEQWIIDAVAFGYDGPFDVLSYLTDRTIGEDIEIVEGPHKHCAGPPLPDPPGLEGTDPLRVSIVATNIDTCLRWFAIDLYLSEPSFIYTIRLSLWEP